MNFKSESRSMDTNYNSVKNSYTIHNYKYYLQIFNWKNRILYSFFITIKKTYVVYKIEIQLYVSPYRRH